MKKQYVGVAVLGLIFAGAIIGFLSWHGDVAGRLLGFAAVPTAALALLAVFSWRMRDKVRENARSDMERTAALGVFALGAVAAAAAASAWFLLIR